MLKIPGTILTAIAWATVFLAVPVICADTNSRDAGNGMQSKLYKVFDSNKNAIVKVYAQKKIPFLNKEGKEEFRATLDVGTGFLIGKDGITATSAYITYGAEKIWIEWCGKLFDANLIGFDPLTTLSIAKISGNFKSLNAPVISIDASAPLPRLGTILLGISNELGFPPSPRMGLASGHNIEFGGAFLPTVYVRTTIAAPKGSAGGAVFDLNGKFVGMLIASLPEAEGSFILPAAAAAKIRDDILLCGEPVYSWFGLQAEDAEGEDGSHVAVKLVAENAPAKKAGFKKGDIILEVNSRKVSNNTELRNITFFVRPRETAIFKVKRGAETVTLEVLAERMGNDIVHAAEANLSPSKNGKNPKDETKDAETKKN